MTPHPTIERLTAGQSDATAAALRRALELDGVVVIVGDLSGQLLYTNSLAESMFGAAAPTRIVPGTPLDAAFRSLTDHLPQRLLTEPLGGSWNGDCDLIVPDVGPRVFETTVAVLRDQPEFPSGLIAAIARDVTQLRTTITRVRHEAAVDELTDLPNRRSILTSLSTAIHQRASSPGHLAVLYFDLDRFKYVNDSLGHDIGDRLIATTARRLRSAIRPIDKVARIGGDEFLVVCEQINDVDHAIEIAERIRRSLSGRLSIRQLELDFSVSVGIAFADDELDGLDDEHAATELVRWADAAMYHAKQTGRGRTVLFTDQMRAEGRERSEMARDLAKAVRAGELHVEYQPIFSAVSQRAEAAEALLRWTHPTKGVVATPKFIAVAEETGLIVAIGEWILEQACAEARRWIDAGAVGPRFSVHVNVSRIQLATPSFVRTVADVLRRSDLLPRQLVLEVREAALLAEQPEVERSVRALRRIGVRVALDNFGTGANALSILTDIGADVLKLDGGLALPTGASDTDNRVVRALVLLAHALGMEVVAERVSGIEQLRRLRAAGCDLVQGNLLGKPAPAARFVAEGSY